MKKTFRYLHVALFTCACAILAGLVLDHFHLLPACLGALASSKLGLALASAPLVLPKEVTDAIGEIKTGIADNSNRLKTVETDSKAASETIKTLGKEIETLQKQLADARRAQLHKPRSLARPGEVSEECARAIGAHFILQIAGFDGLGKIVKDAGLRESLLGQAREYFGIQGKAALTSSDIPLPIEYSGEVVELVSQFGNARKYGTVYPLGTLTTKLPKLTTDPTFGLIAQSASITEKSPQVGWVTFTLEKFGGLIRLPFELDVDSIVAIGQFIARYAARQLAYLEDYNFFAGTGAGSGINGSVAGFTSSTITNSKVVQMAATKTKYSDATLANLRSIRATVDEPCIGRGAYFMHPTFEQHLAGLNTAGDKPYMANGIQGATLDGFPIRWVNVLPAYSTSANVSKVFVLFGDPSYQYLGVQGGPRFDVSREVFFATDELAIRALERFTIGLMANGCVSGLQTAAS